ncbi:hypothetical protein ACIA8O_09460 [Kitasatospora sp. NPDC051853]|uniref:hypothetical protein n=1 Tax=Kitasatospora sp. NPDC051853 TaxID=3364058 RepID=UPI0037922685
MGERISAPRRAAGRRFAAAAALAAVLGGGLAVPQAHAEGPSAPTAKVAGDLTGDGRADLLSVGGSTSASLTVLPAGGAPYVASATGQSPDGFDWSTYQVSSRGSATGGKGDDLFAFSSTPKTLYLYPNDANSGGRPGYFTKKDRAVAVAKPGTCAAGSDCTGYEPSWSAVSQVLATDGVLNSDGMPDLVTLEKGTLWYYPGKAGGAVIGAPVKLGIHNWTAATLIAPGKVGGVPTLWASAPRGTTTALVSYRLEFGPDGLPVKQLYSPVAAFQVQNGERAENGDRQCLGAPGWVAPCSQGGTVWREATDGTLRDGGLCFTLRDGKFGTEDCTGLPGQQWRPTAAGALATADGSCLTVLPERKAGTAPCDGSPRQTWGRTTSDPASGPAPFPVVFDMLTFPSKSKADPWYSAERSYSSQGDLDGDGHPELLATMLSTGAQSLVTVVHRGSAPVGGLAALGGYESLGDLGKRRTTLAADEKVGSLDVYYSACASLKVEPGGSLVVTELATGRVLWSSNSPHTPAGWMEVRRDGTLTLRVSDGSVYWSAAGRAPEGSGLPVLSVQDDCNVVLRDGDGTALWSTRTYDPAHETDGALLLTGRSLKGGEQLVTASTALAMGVDGNLVLTDRRSSRVLWTSGTEGHPGAVVALEADGNLVIRDTVGAPLWDSGTWGTEGARLLVHENGNLALYDTDSKALWSTGTHYTGVDAQGTTIPSGRTLRAGDTVESRVARLVMQPDGNLVLYSRSTGNSRWHSGTWGNEGASATMQSDGNLVVRAADGRALWASGTWTHRNARAVVQDNLDFVLYSPAAKPVWASGTDLWEAARRGTAVWSGAGIGSGGSVTAHGADQPALTMQTDGNLVLTSAGRVLWASGTWGHPGAFLTVQSDGNAVVYGDDGQALWSTRTWGNPNAFLVIQDDGNLVLYDADGVARLWASGTHK